MFTDEQGQRYYDALEAMRELNVKRSKFQKLTAEVAKFRIGDHKVYYRVEDIEALKHRPVQVRLIEKVKSSQVAAA